MRNREIVTRKLEMVEGKIQYLGSMQERLTVNDLVRTVNEMKDLIDEIKSYINQETIMYNVNS